MVEIVNERQVTKKRKIVLPHQITNFFGNHKFYAKSNSTQTYFLEYLMLSNAKGYHPLSFVENPWLRHLVLHQCEWVQFPFRRQLMKVLKKL
jgi:hypothetical protein